jgi:hypothetical protein
LRCAPPPPRTADEKGGRGFSVVPLGLANVFLAQQVQSLQEKRKTMAKVFPVNGKLATVAEAWLALVLKHMQSVSLPTAYS